jgi:acyl dehydratase
MQQSVRTCGQPQAGSTPATVFAEDLDVGVPQPLGRFEMSREAIVAFAEQWDPQPIHVDADAAAEGKFGVLIASGLHTFAVFNRLANLTVYPGWALIAGRDATVQFTRAVREGTVVTGSVTVESVTPYSARSSTVVKSGELHDATTLEPLFEMRATTYMRRRPER